MDTPTSPLALPGFAYDFALRELRREGGERVELRPQTLAVLDGLARHPGILVERDELMHEVWRGLVVPAAPGLIADAGLRLE